MTHILSWGFVRYVGQRLAMAVLTLWALASLTFIFMRAVPGDPLTRTKEIPAAVRANLEAKYGLNKPLFEQYTIQMQRMFFHGDFGESFRTVDRSVNRMIIENFPASAAIGIYALIFGTIIGLTLGILAALYRNTLIDRAAMVLCVIGIAIPSALIAYVIQYLLAVFPLTHLHIDGSHWFRPVGWGQFRDVILPGTTLSLSIITLMTRYMRSQMVDVSFAEFVRTAKAKGASTLRIVVLHQLRNAILPVVSLLGPIFVSAISGSLLIENVFGVPGLGAAYFNSISNNDYNVLMGLTVFYGGFFIIINLITDVVYGLIDPRIRFG
jgi:ABC-type dipeptide/oligopeptide/nickel transport system permease component